MGLATLLVSACGGSAPVYRQAAELTPPPGPPAPLEVQKPFFIAGEQMEWKVSLRGIVGGHVQLAIGDPGVIDGRQVLIVRSRARTTGVAAMIRKVRDEVTTWVDLGMRGPHRLEASLVFGDKRSRVEVDFEPAAYQMLYHRRGAHAQRWRQRLPKNLIAHDAHSALALVRGWRPTPGTQAFFFAVGGRHLWHNVITYRGTGEILTPMGKRPAIRIDGIARRLNRNLSFNTHKKPRSYTVWISNDDKRLPLMVTAKTEYGLIKIELVDWQK